MLGSAVLLLLAGIGIGALGTFIGAGGGFLLMPFLVLCYPTADREFLAAMSLMVVFFNASSGTVAYARMKRVDYRAGLLFAAATIPGAVIGALTTQYIPMRAFDLTLGLVLIAGIIPVLFRPRPPLAHPDLSPADGPHVHELTDSSGTVYRYAFKPALGVAISVVVGFVSSVLGIGGGFIHVPVLIFLLGFPVHVATATSHFVLAIMAFAGISAHVIAGDLRGEYFNAAMLSVGAVAGAQVGARFSSRVRGRWITRALAAALVLVGLRILWSAL